MRKRLFDDLCGEPLVVFTGDQDWAPDWALAAAIELVTGMGVPYHVFATNKSPTLAAARDNELVTLGIHPNFLQGSTQGGTPDEIIENCLALVPEATSFRTHCLGEDNHVLRNLAARGFTADSNLLSWLQPDLVPLLHGAGLLRIPIFFEDDWFLEWAVPDLDLRAAKRQLATPGLKVLNVHPVLLAMNAPSMDYYNQRRPDLYGSLVNPVEPYAGRGVRTLVSELRSFIADAGIRITSFSRVVDDALACVLLAYDEDLYGWPRHPLLHGAQRSTRGA
jgi:hypothetical protein